MRHIDLVLAAWDDEVGEYALREGEGVATARARRVAELERCPDAGGGGLIEGHAT